MALSTLEALLARLPSGGADLEFGQLLEALHQARFTGPLTVDFLNGMPRQINLGQPVRFSIVHGGLDKPGPARTG